MEGGKIEPNKKPEQIKKEETFEWKEGVSFSIEKSKSRSVVEKYTKIEITIFYQNQEAGIAEIFIEPGKKLAEIEWIKISDDFTDLKLGSNLVEGINAYLDAYQFEGVLENIINDVNKRGLYKRHGWEDFSDPSKGNFDNMRREPKVD